MKNFPWRIFLWRRFKLQQVNGVVDKEARQLSGSCLEMKDEGERSGGRHASPSPAYSVAPHLSFSLALDTISFHLLKPLWPRSGTAGEKQWAPEQTQQWKAGETAEAGAAFTQCVPAALLALPLQHCSSHLLTSIPMIPLVASLPSLFCLTKLDFLSKCRA